MKTDDGRAAPPRPARAIVAGLTAEALPAVGEVLHPVLSVIVIVAELALVLTIIAMALFAGPDARERAFRLLRWIGNRPEPPAPGEQSRDASGGTP
jgi:hypothetical protein